MPLSSCKHSLQYHFRYFLYTYKSFSIHLIFLRPFCLWLHLLSSPLFSLLHSQQTRKREPGCASARKEGGGVSAGAEGGRKEAAAARRRRLRQACGRREAAALSAGIVEGRGVADARRKEGGGPGGGARATTRSGGGARAVAGRSDGGWACELSVSSYLPVIAATLPSLCRRTASTHGSPPSPRLLPACGGEKREERMRGKERRCNQGQKGPRKN